MPPSGPPHPGGVLCVRGLGPGARVGELGQGVAAALSPAGTEAVGGPPGVVRLPGLEGVEHSPVAHHRQQVTNTVMALSP